MMDFLFRRKNDPPPDEGQIHLSPTLLQQMGALKAGQFIHLPNVFGRSYAIVLYDDLKNGCRYSETVSESR
jgi:hypothetical protein